MRLSLNLISLTSEITRPPSVDTIKELAHSPLIVETSSKGGKGLEKGLSLTLDLLVDKYFTIPNSDDPDKEFIPMRKGTARQELVGHITCEKKI